MTDLRIAWRQLRHELGFVLLAVSILALGMTATVTACSVVTHVLWQPLPVPDAERVIGLSAHHPQTAEGQDLAPADFVELRDRLRSLEHLSAVEPFNLDLSDGAHPEVVRAGRVTAGFFEAFGVQAAYGRVFGPEDYRVGQNAVALLTWRFWREHFAGDPRAVGSTVRLDGEPHTIVGVLPDRFETGILVGSAPRQVFTPVVRDPVEGRVQVVGRLRANSTAEIAQAELSALTPQIVAARRAHAALRFSALPFREHVVGALRPALTVFNSAMVLVLLLACVNVANLLLARGLARRHEFSVRLALGASRRRLIVPVLVESLLLAILAGAFSLWFADMTLRGLARMGPADIPFLDTVALDIRAMLLALALVPLVAALTGLMPAIHVAYMGRFVSTARTSTAGRDHHAWRNALVACQVALALAMVTGAGLLLRSFSNLIQEDVGFERDRAAVLQVMAWSRQPNPVAQRRFFEEARMRLANLPGVEAVGGVSAMPFIEANIDIRSRLTFVGQSPRTGEEPPMVSVTIVTPGYFEAVGGRLLRGRLLDARDAPGRPDTAVISEALALQHFRGRDPIGAKIEVSLQRRLRVVEIVGVVASFKHETLDGAPRAEVFLPHAQAPFGAMAFVLKTHSDPATVLEAARAAIWSIDPQQSFYQTGTLRQLVDQTIAARRFTLKLVAGIAALSLLLAAAGLYAVLSTVVAQYRRELGVRIALGAGTFRIVTLVVGRGMRMAIVGIAIGLVCAAAGSRVLRRFLYAVDPVDAMAFAGAAGLMLTVAAVTCYFPARRAAATNPIEVLVID